MALLMVFLAFIFFSCTFPLYHVREDLPVGVWKSENPCIKLYIIPEYQIPDRGMYAGLFTVNDETVKIFIAEYVRHMASNLLLPISI
jgi:hypothetical protein